MTLKSSEFNLEKLAIKSWVQLYGPYGYTWCRQKIFAHDLVVCNDVVDQIHDKFLASSPSLCKSQTTKRKTLSLL